MSGDDRDRDPGHVETQVGTRKQLHAIPTAEDGISYPAPSWDRRDSTISSTDADSGGRRDSVTGRVTVTGTRIGEGLAREILYRRFTSFGAVIQSEYLFRMGTVMCTLDGYDPGRKIGYAFVSHADADVVTDIDGDVELEIYELCRQGSVQILVVHDTAFESLDQLVIHVDKFLHGLPR